MFLYFLGPAGPSDKKLTRPVRPQDYKDARFLPEIFEYFSHKVHRFNGKFFAFGCPYSFPQEIHAGFMHPADTDGRKVIFKMAKINFSIGASNPARAYY